MDKWKKLKEIIIEEIKSDEIEYNRTGNIMYDASACSERWVLDIMEGLENLELDIEKEKKPTKSSN